MHPVEYRVRVPRLRDNWSSPTHEDRLDIENLGAGDWRVDIEARVEGTKDWSEPLALDVAVAPFWYETIPGRIGIFALIALAITVVVWLRLRALRRHRVLERARRL